MSTDYKLTLSDEAKRALAALPAPVRNELSEFILAMVRFWRWGRGSHPDAYVVLAAFLKDPHEG